MITKMLGGVALLAMACSPAFAQMSLSKGQVATIGADGQITTGAMPTDPKMMKMMHSRGKAMGKTVMIWMDDKGHMRICDCGENDRH